MLARLLLSAVAFICALPLALLVTLPVGGGLDRVGGLAATCALITFLLLWWHYPLADELGPRSGATVALGSFLVTLVVASLQPWGEDASASVQGGVLMMGFFFVWYPLLIGAGVGLATKRLRKGSNPTFQRTATRPLN